MRKYKVWDPTGIYEPVTIEAKSIGAAAIRALDELGYDIAELWEGENDT